MANEIKKQTIARQNTENPLIAYNSPILWFGALVTSFRLSVGLNGSNPTKLSLSVVEDNNHLLDRSKVHKGKIVGFPIGTKSTDSTPVFFHGVIQMVEDHYNKDQVLETTVVIDSVRSLMSNIYCITSPEGDSLAIANDSILNLYSIAENSSTIASAYPEWDIYKPSVGMPMNIFKMALDGCSVTIFGVKIWFEIDFDTSLIATFNRTDCGYFIKDGMASLNALLDECTQATSRTWIESTEVEAGGNANFEPTELIVKIKTINRSTDTALSWEDFQSFINVNPQNFVLSKFNNIKSIVWGEELRTDATQQYMFGNFVEFAKKFDVNTERTNKRLFLHFGILPNTPQLEEDDIGDDFYLISDDNSFWSKRRIMLQPIIRKLISQDVIYFDGVVPDGNNFSSLNEFFNVLSFARRSPDRFYLLLAIYLLPEWNGTTWNFLYHGVSGHPLLGKAWASKLESLWTYINGDQPIIPYLSNTVVSIRKKSNVSLSLLDMLQVFWTCHSVDQINDNMTPDMKSIFWNIMNNLDVNIPKWKGIVERRLNVNNGSDITADELGATGLMAPSINPSKWIMSWARLEDTYRQFNDLKKNFYKHWIFQIPTTDFTVKSGDMNYLVKGTHLKAVPSAWCGSKIDGEYQMPIVHGANVSCLDDLGGMQKLIAACDNEQMFLSNVDNNGKLSAHAQWYYDTVDCDPQSYDISEAETYDDSSSTTYLSSKVSVVDNIKYTKTIHDIGSRTNYGPYGKACDNYTQYALLEIEGGISRRQESQGCCNMKADLAEFLFEQNSNIVYFSYVPELPKYFFIPFQSFHVRYGPWWSYLVDPVNWHADWPTEIKVMNNYCPWTFGSDKALYNAGINYCFNVKKTLNGLSRAQIVCEDYYRDFVLPGCPLTANTDSILSNVDCSLTSSGWETVLTFQSYGRIPGIIGQLEYDQLAQRKTAIQDVEQINAQKIEGWRQNARIWTKPEIVEKDGLSDYLAYLGHGSASAQKEG